MKWTNGGKVRNWAGLGSFLCFFLLSGAASGLDVPLEFHSFSEHDLANRRTPVISGWIQCSFQRPAGNWKLPEHVGTNPVYGIVELAGERRLLLLDREKTGDRFYNRLHFDDNANSDLRDDKSYKGRVTVDGDRVFVVFPPIDTTVPDGNGRSLYRIRPYAYCPQSLIRRERSAAEMEAGFSFAFTVAGFYSGTFESGGQTYTVAIEDSNANGSFLDPFTLPALKDNPLERAYNPTGDRVYVTTASRITVHDAIPGLKRLIIQDNVYEASFRGEERKLVLSPARETLYTVQLGMETSRLIFTVDDGKATMLVYGSEGKVRLPEGRYRLASYEALRKDAAGAIWRLDAVGKEDGPLFVVGKNTGHEFGIGEPFRFDVDCSTSSSRSWRSKYTRLRLYIRGRADELVTNLRKIEGERTSIEMSRSRGKSNYPKEPTYRIVYRDDRLPDEVGKFEYG